MPKPRSKSPKLVDVIWDDACFHQGYQGDGEDLNPVIRMHTAGFLVTNTKTHVGVAQDWQPDNACFRHISTIPRGMIVSMKHLRGGH